MKLYEQKLQACALPNCQSHYIATKAGQTHVIETGDASKTVMILLHGINAGAPVALEAVKALYTKYRIFAVDSIGQATKSAETRLSVKDNSYGIWLGEVMSGLNVDKAAVVGISYGGFLLQKLIMAHPEKVSKAIFIVPGGVVNSDFAQSIRHLFFPLMRYMLTKNESHLKKFIGAFYTQIDGYAIAFQRETLLGLKMDYTRPPLLDPKLVESFKKPVYAMVVDNDIFFPGEACLKKLRAAFAGFKAHYILENSKHIPAPYQYEEISNCLDKWMQE